MAKVVGREPKIFFPSLTQLRAFSEAARLDSISRASEELRRSQSAVTQAVQNLEAELGVALLARTSTGSYLTDMGRILQTRAEACFSRMDMSLQDVLEDYDSLNLARASSVARRITKSQILALIAVNEHGSFAQAARHVQVSLTSLHRSAQKPRTANRPQALQEYGAGSHDKRSRNEAVEPVSAGYSRTGVGRGRNQLPEGRPDGTAAGWGA